ncbi:hypothetical protein D3C71_1360420 [compost metagenome]
MNIMSELNAGSKFHTKLLEHVRNGIQISMLVKYRTTAPRMDRKLRFLPADKPTTAVSSHLDTNHCVTFLYEFIDIFLELCDISATSMAITRDRRTTGTSQKLIDWQVRFFAFDIPQGHINTTDSRV